MLGLFRLASEASGHEESSEAACGLSDTRFLKITLQRITVFLQTLLKATEETNEALNGKRLELELANQKVNDRATELSHTSRQTRSHIEELLMTGKRLNYRMSDLDRSAAALDTTLLAQRLRTKDAMEITGAEGANEDLKWKPGELK